MVKRKSIKKEGWNKEAFLKSFVWYYNKGMTTKAVIMAVLVLLTLGIGIIPVMFYCGLNGNKDFYHTIKRNSLIL